MTSEMSLQVKRLEQRAWPLGFSIGPGWYTLVENLDTELTKILGPDYEIHQIKEKFGGLRYYIGGVPPEVTEEVYKLIDKAETESGKICEECGSPGRFRDDLGNWYVTLCDTCAGEVRNRRYAQ